MRTQLNQQVQNLDAENMKLIKENSDAIDHMAKIAAKSVIMEQK